jgi:hypothetical protein
MRGFEYRQREAVQSLNLPCRWLDRSAACRTDPSSAHAHTSQTIFFSITTSVYPHRLRPQRRCHRISNYPFNPHHPPLPTTSSLTLRRKISQHGRPSSAGPAEGRILCRPGSLPLYKLRRSHAILIDAADTDDLPLPTTHSIGRSPIESGPYRPYLRSSDRILSMHRSLLSAPRSQCCTCAAPLWTIVCYA